VRIANVYACAVAFPFSFLYANKISIILGFLFLALGTTALAKKRAGFGTRLCQPITEFCYVL